MSPQQVNDLVGQLPGVKEISEHYEGCATVSLGSLVGSAFSLVAASVVRERGGVHVFVMEDRDAAA